MGNICFLSLLDFPGTGKLRKEVAKRKEKSKTEKDLMHPALEMKPGCWGKRMQLG